MAEYVAREELIKRIENSISSWGRDCNSNAQLMVRAYQDVLQRVKTVPTADVQEVKHGRKIVRKRHRGFHSINCPICSGTFQSNKPYSEDVEYCSECGKKLDDTFQNYCPNCGAKMDGGESG